MLNEGANERENERKALEAYLPDKVAFSLPETAKILNRSVHWAREEAASGKLKSVRIGATVRVTRPVIVAALMEGVENKRPSAQENARRPRYSQHPDDPRK